MTQQSGDNRDLQLPGYNLVSRIGEGGYGEVWLANAPGGLTKAVKFIFGFHNEKRAERELHSLEKIKSVRHPFLLSLERIEIIEGRLVIVTELADASLRDRFEACVKEGMPGIPRNELLRYLRDTADALDYLGDEHSLQHLDVKPENLLLLAGHIKVADFGLVKEIQDTQASLVGGMTPLYSAPEVFQGRPSSFSDQYSLAILYQEMLTGQLPFKGATSAELTLQHMHDEPDLGSLPMADRYVLARALSKDPGQRFGSCGEMIESLISTSTSDSNSQPGKSFTSNATAPNTQQVQFLQPARRPGAMTQVFEDDLIVEDAEVSKSMLLEMPPAAQLDSDAMPPLDLFQDGFQATPTLVIGIGGTAGHILAELRRQINFRHRISESVPAVQMLLLDTDPKALRDIAQDDATGLTSDETLTLALRRPQEYRDRSKQLLNWLSRRWLYNIPKSLRTEGLRPLGRLAFADHSRRTLQRIRLSLTKALDPSGIAKSNIHTGLQFREQAVRVYVVSSISGGTGSGMSLDISYAVEMILEKLGVCNATTVGMFLHSTGRDSRFSDLAKVNTYSWLTEFNHFKRPGGSYPGDSACGLPAQQSGARALNNSYFVHLGDGLGTEEYLEQTKSIAEYLYLDVLTPAQPFFEASRTACPTSANGSPSLRTIGLHKVSIGSPEALEAAAAELCHRVVLEWVGSNSSHSQTIPTATAHAGADSDTAPISDTNQLVCGSARAVSQLQLSLQAIAANARAIIESQFGNRADQLLEKLLVRLEESGKPATNEEIVRLVDGLFASPQNTACHQEEFILQRPLDSIVSPLGMKLAGDLQKWLLQRLDDRQERLLGTQSAAEWFAAHFQRVEVESIRLAKRIEHQMSNLLQTLKPDDHCATAAGCTCESRLKLAGKYLRLRIDRCALLATARLAQMLQRELESLREAVVEFGIHLRHLAETLAQSPEAPEQDNHVAFVDTLACEQDPIVKLLFSNDAQHTIAIDQQLQEEFIDHHGGLFEAVMSSGKVLSKLLVALRAIAKQHVEQFASEMSFSSSDDALLNGERNFQSVLKSLADMNPLLADKRQGNLLAIVPQNDVSSQRIAKLRESTETAISTLTYGKDLLFCCESGHVSLVHTALELIQCRRDYAEFAKRVHTRNDVDWTPLASTSQNTNQTNQEVQPAFATQVL